MTYGTKDQRNVLRFSCNLGLCAAIVACLSAWGGIAMKLTPAPSPAPGESAVAQAEHRLAEVLLLPLPLALAVLACGAGVLSVALGRDGDRALVRRALIAITLSLAPMGLCTLRNLAFELLSHVGR
jgi:hypothetical protein